MDIAKIRSGMHVAGKRVTRIARPVSAGRMLTRLYFADGSCSRVYGQGERVDQVATRLTIDAGPVQEGWYVASTPKVRVTSGKWRGEQASRHDKLVANGVAFSMFATSAGVRA